MTRISLPHKVVGILAVATAALAVLGGGTSVSAFSGSVTGTTDTVAVADVSTCRNADLADRPSRLYSLASNGGGTNQGSAGAGTGATFVGSVLGSGFVAGGGCTRDPQSYYTAYPGLLTIAARWVSTAGPTDITSSGALTQEVWFRTSKPGGQLLGFGTSDGGLLGGATSSSTALQVFVTSSGALDFATGGPGVTNNELLTTSGNFADDSWHQVAAVYDNGVKQLYVDGALQNSAAASTSSLRGAFWRIGYDRVTDWNEKTTSNYFDGGLQWAALYPRALTAAQIAAHYRARIG